MDYCSSCRRHLNGALVCPGCGAYAPDIAPDVAGGRAVPGPAGLPATDTAAWEPASSGPWRDERPQREAPADEAPPGDTAAATLAPLGRAARRRQRERWKRNQRRAVVATAVALVGGGLTVSSMNRHSADRTQAAPAPDVNSMGAEEAALPPYTPPASPSKRSAHRSAPDSSPPSPTDLTRRHTVAVPPRTQSAASTERRTTDLSAPQQQRAATPTPTATTPVRTDTEAPSTPAPASTAGTDQDTAQTSPSPSATSPSQLCVLVLCLG